MMIMAICHDPTSFLVRGLVYERVQLGSLKYQLDIRKNGTLSAEEWIPLMLQIVDATMFLHESGIIHQVICPESIMLCDHRTAKLGMLAFSRLSHDASRNWEVSLFFKFYSYPLVPFEFDFKFQISIKSS